MTDTPARDALTDQEQITTLNYALAELRQVNARLMAERSKISKKERDADKMHRGAIALVSRAADELDRIAADPYGDDRRRVTHVADKLRRAAQMCHEEVQPHG